MSVESEDDIPIGVTGRIASFLIARNTEANEGELPASKMLSCDGEGALYTTVTNLDEIVTSDPAITAWTTNSETTIATTGELLLAANATRKKFLVQNKSAEDVYVSFGTQGAAGEGLWLLPGGSTVTDTSQKDAVYGRCAANATLGAATTALLWVAEG